MCLLKLVFEILICVRLEHPSNPLPLYYVMIPLWIVLPLALYDLARELRKGTRAV